MFWVILVIAVANSLGTLTGFGGVSLSMPFLIPMIGVDTAKNLLLISGLVQPIYLAVILRRHVNWKVVKTIFLSCVFTVPAGLLLYNHLPAESLIVVLSMMMIFSGITGILKLRNININTDSKGWLLFILIVGGIMQGALLTGALLAIYTANYITDKTEFRATISVIWVATLGSVVLIKLINRSMPQEIFTMSAYILPFVIAGVVGANIVADKISQRVFAYMINIVMLLGGIAILM